MRFMDIGLGMLGGFGGGLIGLFAGIVGLIGAYKTFVKAGHTGWHCLVPFWNVFVIVRIAGKPFWWFFLCFVPVVNFLAFFVIAVGVAERFGKDALFGIGLLLLAPIFWAWLGLGPATYRSVT